MSAVPADISHRARPKLLSRFERRGTHSASITASTVIVSIPLICISPIVIMMAKVRKKWQTNKESVKKHGFFHTYSPFFSHQTCFFHTLLRFYFIILPPENN
jgi:ABC-type sulfate transport system permease component